MDSLKTPPTVGVETVADHTAEARCDRGFLRLRRLTLQNVWDDGSRSATYPYDVVDRDALDAVALVLHTADGRVCLRSALRPPLAFVDGVRPVLWEVPAGLIEPDETGEAGRRECAARETREEVGLTVPPDAYSPLGPPLFMSPGVLAERLYFYAVQVDPDTAEEPTLDGSPTEERAEIVYLPLEEALAACAEGVIADMKTELALRRLKERLA